MNLVRWDPFRELEDMSSRLNRLFGATPMLRGIEEDGNTFADWTPAVDLEETDKEYTLKADLPDMQKAEVKVGIEAGVLTIEGERKREKEEKGKKFHRIERSYGKFVRKLPVPSDVDQSHVGAEFKDGVLQVHMPKSATATPRALDIKIM
jgi:HSP20 family protein